MLEAILLGIIEGLTEFLPISSTGHLIVAEEYIQFRDTAKIFTVVIQLGAIAAVVWYYRVDLWQKLLGLFERRPLALRFWLNIVIASLPGGVLGLILSTQQDKYAVPAVVAVALITGAFVLFWVDRVRPVDVHQKLDIEKIKPRQALLIGLAQAVALIPGVSRSGASIVGGVLTGLNRVSATAFSFYLGIPILGVAGLYKLLDSGGELSSVQGGWTSIILGSAVSFIVALLAISWLLRYVSSHSFKLFAYYRIALGLLILVLLI